jgi:NADH:ubiquinone oxidoreductase subunit 6 (subunit J)
MSPLVIAFLVLAFLTCGSALSMLWTKNLLHAALAMFLTMLGLAGLYVLAYADVVAVAHLLVYVGGVLILILFGIMLTNQTDPATGKNHLTTRESNRLFPLSVGLSFFLGLFWLFTKGPWINSLPLASGSKLKDVGLGLLTDYAFPFELAGVFLLIALIGATFVAKNHD